MRLLQNFRVRFRENRVQRIQQVRQALAQAHGCRLGQLREIRNTGKVCHDTAVVDRYLLDRT